MGPINLGTWARWEYRWVPYMGSKMVTVEYLLTSTSVTKLISGLLHLDAQFFPR